MTIRLTSLAFFLVFSTGCTRSETSSSTGVAPPAMPEVSSRPAASAVSGATAAPRGPAAASWVGTYTFSDNIKGADDGINPFWTYEVRVAGTNAPWSVHVAVDGTQTMTRIQATGEEANGVLTVRYEHPGADDTLPDPSLKKNDVLFRIAHVGAGTKATLTFDGLKSGAESKSLVGTYRAGDAPACGAVTWKDGVAKNVALVGTMTPRQNKGKSRYVLDPNEGICPPFAAGANYHRIGLVDSKKRLRGLMTSAGYFGGRFVGTLRQGGPSDVDAVVMDIDADDAAIAGIAGE
jgi:hypothetical protein